MNKLTLAFATALLAAGCATEAPPPAESMQHGPGGGMQPGAMQPGAMQPGAMQHGAMQHGAMQNGTMQQGGVAGQSAFAAVSEVVKLLEADSSTDWSKVDLEALRQHLIDIDLVTLRSKVRQSPVTSGAAIEITGDAQVAPAIQRMVGAHARMLDAMAAFRASVVPLADGVRLTVTSRTPGDSAAATRIRALGFIGLMVQGEHHATHHLMLARGAEHAHGG